MEIVDIITRDMHQLHGANKVTEKLILGRQYFEERGFKLRYVISQDGIIDCEKYSTSALGVHLDSKSYKYKRSIIEMLKRIPIYKLCSVQDRIIWKEITANQIVADYYNSLEKKADIIMFQDPYTAIYFVENGVEFGKSIFISHADTDPLEHLLLGRPSVKGTDVEDRIRRQYETMFHKMGRVITICNSSKNYMKTTYNLECPCIINGIEDVIVEDLEKYSETDGRIHIAIVASVQYRKGQDLAIEALAKLNSEAQKKIKLHIFGGGTSFENIKKLIDKLNLRESVILYGPVLDIEKRLPKMDVFLLPSRADTVPISIIEALRAGLPVFATNVGEVPYMIEGCGKLIEPTIGSIEECFNLLCSRTIDLYSMSIKSRKRFTEEFQLNAMIEKYCLVMNELSV